MTIRIRVFTLLALLSVLPVPSLGVELVHDRPGQVLLFPMFTTENGWDTYITVMPQDLTRSYDRTAGMFTVRFLRGRDGTPIKTFNVYNARATNWRVSLTGSAENSGSSTLRMAEGYCIVDENLNALVEGDSLEIPDTVGMIEIYAIDTLHLRAECDELAARWETGSAWDLNPSDGRLPAPFNRNLALYGEAYLVNVGQGLSATYEPEALIGLRPSLTHNRPGANFPNLAQADPEAIVDGEVIVPESGLGIDAVALALTGDQSMVINDVIAAPEINARTDWVLSYPLEPYKNFKPFLVEFEEGQRRCEEFGRRWNLDPDMPTVEAILDGTVGVTTWGSGAARWAEWDPAPTVPYQAALCSAVNVVSFGGHPPVLVDEDSALLSAEPDPVAKSLTESSLGLRWRPQGIPRSREPYFPRPVTGFRLTVFQNGTLNDGRTLANYATLRSHQRVETD